VYSAYLGKKELHTDFSTARSKIVIFAALPKSSTYNGQDFDGQDFAGPCLVLAYQLVERFFLNRLKVGPGDESRGVKHDCYRVE
jgi:hypothetical protein